MKRSSPSTATRSAQQKAKTPVACLFLLIWVLSLYSSGLYFFKNGFLLTRLRLENNSTCLEVPTFEGSANADDTALLDGKDVSSCWYPARYKKAVVILIDALRFDFAVFNETLAAEEGDGNDAVPFYQNRLRTIHKKLKAEPEHAFLFQTIADPPTTTLQRLKGITTGTLPTFVEAGNNFAGTAIGEDNIVDQLAKLNRRIAFMGDDTWMALFPTAFRESLKFPYPSFEVWDLHTVDNGVMTHLIPLLDESSSRDWDVIVAHFLGVDHCGHRYGPQHIAMKSKLEQLDSMLEKVLDRIDDETLVVVLGDHGMDSKGDHGGDSPQEVEAALFMYSKKKLGSSALSRSQSLSSATKLEDLLRASDLDSGWKGFTTQHGGHRSIPQIDLVPTLSLLLGAPVPFNNLGSIIPEFFYHATTHDGGGQTEEEHLLRVLRINAYQMHRYMNHYADSQPQAELTLEYLSSISPLLADAERIRRKDSESQHENHQQAIIAYMTYLRRGLSLCRKVWAQFDLSVMGVGLGICLGTSLIVFIMLRKLALVPFADDYVRRTAWIAAGSSAIGAGIGPLSSIANTPLSPVANVTDLAIFGSSACSISLHLLNSFSNHHQPPIPTRSNFFALISQSFIMLPLLLMSAANSSIIHEDIITSFFLQTFALVQLVASMFDRSEFTPHRRSLCCIGFLILTRLNHTVKICREEQLPYCVPSFYASLISSTPSAISIAGVAVLAIMLPSILRRIFRETNDFHHSAQTWISWGLPITLLLSAAYWCLETFYTDYMALKVYLIRFVAGSIIMFLCGIWWPQPQCFEDIEPSSNATGESNPPRQNPFSQVRSNHENNLGAPFVLFLILTYSLLIMVQQPAAIISLTATFGNILLMLEIFDLRRKDAITTRKHKVPSSRAHLEAEIASSFHRTSISLPPQRNVSLLEPFILSLIGNQAFFSTGHQATISSIQWNSGFIGLFDSNVIVTPILIALNTFGGPILAACAVPALVLWKLPASINPRSFDSRSVPRDVIYLEILRVGLLYLLITLGISVTAASFWTGYFRRHLMVWKVFAPRWMMIAATGCLCNLFMIVIAIGFAARRVIDRASAS